MPTTYRGSEMAAIMSKIFKTSLRFVCIAEDTYVDWFTRKFLPDPAVDDTRTPYFHLAAAVAIHPPNDTYATSTCKQADAASRLPPCSTKAKGIVSRFVMTPGSVRGGNTRSEARREESAPSQLLRRHISPSALASS